jgi:hypothetical protein
MYDSQEIARPRHIVIACGVLKKELLAWSERERYQLEFLFLPSSVDLDFNRLQTKLVKSLRTAVASRRHGHRFVLYGQCHPMMGELVGQEGGILLPLGNCFELLLGRERYQEHLANGAYFLLPQWAGQWNQIFTTKLGFNLDAARLFFPEMHNHALYLDTGFSYNPAFNARQFTDFTGLPVKFQKIDCSAMYARLNAVFFELLDQARGEGFEGEQTWQTE